MKPVSNKVSSAVLSPLEGHSEKPQEVRDRIVELFGDVPRIELFARQKMDGWDAWGDGIA
jgi:site-specific DNA-methyltransferase (adenine-specific)